MNGFIKLDRAIQDSFLWNDCEKLKAWLDLLFQARWQEKTVKKSLFGSVIELKQNQIFASIRFLQKRWRWNSLGKVRRFISDLEKEGFIEIDFSCKGTLLTICGSTYYGASNYSITNGTQNGTPNGTETEHQNGRINLTVSSKCEPTRNTKRNRNGTPNGTNIKNYKEKENNPPPSPPKCLRQKLSTSYPRFFQKFDYPEETKKKWERWMAYKHQQFKFRYKKIGEKEALQKLFIISSGQLEFAGKILSNAMANGWSGFFKLKNQNGKKNGISKERIAIVQNLLDE